MASIEDKIAAAEKRAQEAAKQVKQLKAQRDMVEARKLQTILKGHVLTTPAARFWPVPWCWT